jgi:hypothetical protein
MIPVILLSWLLANFWLLLCRVIPPIRPHLGLCHAIGIGVAFLYLLLPPDGPDVADVIACSIAAAIILAQYLYAASKLRAPSSRI